MDRSFYREEHEMSRRSFRQFCEREVVPHQERWREEGMVDREVWRKAARAPSCVRGFPRSGGPGGDFLHSCVIGEELCRIYESGFAMMLHSDIIVPYIYEFGDDDQKKRFLPGCISGDLVTAIAMTEPGQRSRRHRHERREDGSD